MGGAPGWLCWGRGQEGFLLFICLFFSLFFFLCCLTPPGVPKSFPQHSDRKRVPKKGPISEPVCFNIGLHNGTLFGPSKINKVSKIEKKAARGTLENVPGQGTWFGTPAPVFDENGIGRGAWFRTPGPVFWTTASQLC